MEVVPLNRTLDQELLALMRGASLECPLCREFVMHVAGTVVCPECGSRFEEAVRSGVQLSMQAG